MVQNVGFLVTSYCFFSIIRSVTWKNATSVFLICCIMHAAEGIIKHACNNTFNLCIWHFYPKITTVHWIHGSIHPSIHPSIHSSIYCICLSVYLSVRPIHPIHRLICLVHFQYCHAKLRSWVHSFFPYLLCHFLFLLRNRGKQKKKNELSKYPTSTSWFI